MDLMPFYLKFYICNGSTHDRLIPIAYNEQPVPDSQSLKHLLFVGPCDLNHFVGRDPSTGGNITAFPDPMKVPGTHIELCYFPVTDSSSKTTLLLSFFPLRPEPRNANRDLAYSF